VNGSPARTLAPIAAAAALLGALAVASPARADASGWAFVGGGAVGWKQAQEPRYTTSGSLLVEGGVGTDPLAPVIVGGVFRFQPIMLHAGIDLSLLLRVATRGFQGGSWGVAVDLGGFARPWGFQSVGFAGSASIGLPLGFTLMGLGSAGIDHSFTFGAVAGIDLLRLTVYRRTLLDVWRNPSPAGSITASKGPGFSF
jgi:hypothetical protein